MDYPYGLLESMSDVIKDENRRHRLEQAKAQAKRGR